MCELLTKYLVWKRLKSASSSSQSAGDYLGAQSWFPKPFRAQNWRRPRGSFPFFSAPGSRECLQREPWPGYFYPGLRRQSPGKRDSAGGFLTPPNPLWMSWYRKYPANAQKQIKLNGPPGRIIWRNKSHLFARTISHLRRENLWVWGLGVLNISWIYGKVVQPASLSPVNWGSGDLNKTVQFCEEQF